jgi:hypothetical protein
MKPLVLLAFAAAGYAQSPFRTDPTRIFIVAGLRTDPPSPALSRRFVPYLRDRAIPNGPAFFTRIFLDDAHHAYFGYELLLERKQTGTYLATVGKLGITPIDLATSLVPGPIDLGWTNLPIPSIPDPRLLQDGETISVDVFVDPSTGSKLIDDIRVNPPLPARGLQPVPVAPPLVPTVSGTARDFSAADAELQLQHPRAVLVNGNALNGPISRNVRGPLLWLYVPKHGRYILSLIPRPGLDFIEAGEVRGGAISFKLGEDSIKIECATLIATGDAPYHLWVLQDPDWEPVSESRKDRPDIGSVGAAELAALKRN